MTRKGQNWTITWSKTKSTLWVDAERSGAWEYKKLRREAADVHAIDVSWRTDIEQAGTSKEAGIRAPDGEKHAERHVCVRGKRTTDTYTPMDMHRCMFCRFWCVDVFICAWVCLCAHAHVSLCREFCILKQNARARSRVSIWILFFADSRNGCTQARRRRATL